MDDPAESAPAGPGPSPADTPAPAAPDVGSSAAGASDAAPGAGKVPPLDGGERARPGQSSARGEHQRDANHLIVGDAVAGDKIIYTSDGAPPKRLRRLSPQLVEEVRSAFVEPDDWATVRRAFADQRIAILQGAIGSGRTAMAIRLLRDLAPEPIYHVSLDDVLDIPEFLDANRRAPNRVEASSAFLVAAPSGLGSLAGATLHGIEAALDDVGCRLVVTVAADDRLADDELLRYVLALPSPPPPELIMRQHLYWRLGEDDQITERVLGNPAVKTLLNETLTEGVACHTAEALGRHLAACSDTAGETVDVDAVRARMTQRRTNEFDIWFDSLSNADRCFAIALAAMDGLPHEDVARAARMLARQLDRSPDMVLAGTAGPQTFLSEGLQTVTRRRQRALHATTKQTRVLTEHGRVAATTMHFLDDAYAGQVLRKAWRERDIQAELLAWLSELVVDGSEQVRVFAGTTLGIFATDAFGYVSREVLLGWAKEAARELREAAALAVGVAARDAVLRPTVVNVVSTWFTETAAPELRATAVRAHGLSLGLTLNKEGAEPVLRALDHHAKVDDRVLANAISETLADLILTDRAGSLLPVLQTLQRWIGDRERPAAGQFAFLWLADALFTEVASPVDDYPAKPATMWPLLLEAARQQGPVRKPLASLWRATFLERKWAAQAEAVFTAWATRAENDGDMLDTFARLVREIGSNSVAARVLLYLAEDWVSDRRQRRLVRAAETVQTVLGQ